ncbi:MAG: molybdenum cofactor guanylyltransferase [Deltaproteobacteria bacterium]|nr:molybdenum cofactor guanylyltransferase [Deltaproteobacteria bacterium]
MISGAVLAGGMSRRYGRNKAVEVFRGKRLVDSAVEVLQSFCDPVFVVINDLSLYWDLPVTLIQDVLPGQGPLGGIYTALLFSPNEWVFVRATDMPLLVPELLLYMCEVRPGFDAVVPVFNGLHEPLFALYHRRCLAPIASLLERGERKIVRFFPGLRVRKLQEEEWRPLDAEGLSFVNVNTPEDWGKIP